MFPTLGNAYVNNVGQPLVQAMDWLTMTGPAYRAAYEITPGLKPAGEIPLGDVMSAGSNAVATGEVPAAATPEGLAGAASPAVPAAATPVAADPATVDLTSNVEPLTFSTGEAKAAEPIAGTEPGLAAGTGAGTPAVATGDREAYYAAIKAAESGNNPNAQSNTSSASGYYGFTDGTWSALAQK